MPAFAAMLARGMATEPSVPALHKHAEQLITQPPGPGQARAAKLALAGGPQAC